MKISLLQRNLGTKGLEGGLDLVSILLGNVLLENLWSSLDKLLGLDKGEIQKTLDLLDDLWLTLGVEGLELNGEDGLLLWLLLGNSLLLNGSWGSWSGTGSWEGDVWDVELGLELGDQRSGLEEREL